MSDQDLEQLLAPMAEHEPDAGARRYQVDREKIVSRMVEASLSPEDRALPWWRFGAALSAAAGLALAVWAGGHFLGGAPEPQATLPGMEIVALRGQLTRPSPDGMLETSAGTEARIKVHGLELDVQENSRVSLRELGAAQGSAALRLERGRVRCVIPHRPGRTFAVVTADARVVDVGTVFSVDVRPWSGQLKTFVHVEEGEVVVHHAGLATRVTAAHSWSSVAPQAASRAAAEESAPGTEESRHAPTGAPRALPKRARETLNLETQLLRSGLAAEQKGELREAARAFERLVARYPESPLAPDAKAALVRVKGRLESGK